MCGIIGYVGSRALVPVLVEGLKRLEYRGYGSAGIALASNGSELAVRPASGKLVNLERELAANPVEGTYGLGHTRWATHGSPSQRNAHPHTDCHRRLAVVHNGIIENHFSLEERLSAAGHSFSSDTDSEVIAHLIVKARQGIIIGLVNEGGYRGPQQCDSAIEIPPTCDLLLPLLEAVPLQLLAYHIAVWCGCDVDQPRNLAKSVTVE